LVVSDEEELIRRETVAFCCEDFAWEDPGKQRNPDCTTVSLSGHNYVGRGSLSELFIVCNVLEACCVLVFR
jgi:hypothetical protein